MELTWTQTMTSAPERPHEPEAETAWIAAARGGDQDAFASLVRRHQRRVFRLAGRFFRRPEDVEDAAQETFLIAWRKLHTYQARAPFEHWLTRVCLNCCYQKLRSNRHTELGLADEREPQAPERDLTASLEVERLLETLPAKDRFILLLLDGEGWSVAEIAERLGWTSVNVKVRAHRARKKLKAILERGLDP